jgi:hypothetical protein
MSAFAVGKSVIQLETGIYGIKENHSLLEYDARGFGLDLTLRYGALLEIRINRPSISKEDFTTPLLLTSLSKANCFRCKISYLRSV